MKTLFVAATQPEIDPSLAKLKQEGFDILITGVGMVATAYHLGKALQGSRYDLLVNVGIAGSFSSSLSLGTVVHVVKDQFIEFGAEDHDIFLSSEQLGFGQSAFENTATLDLPSLRKLPQVNGVTVNTVHGNSESIATLKNKLPDITIESMEGAAVFYAAQQMNIPVVQVRAISNYVEPRDRNNWKIGLAIDNINAWVPEFVNAIALNRKP